MKTILILEEFPDIAAIFKPVLLKRHCHQRQTHLRLDWCYISVRHDCRQQKNKPPENRVRGEGKKDTEPKILFSVTFPKESPVLDISVIPPQRSYVNGREETKESLTENAGSDQIQCDSCVSFKNKKK